MIVDSDEDEEMDIRAIDENMDPREDTTDKEDDAEMPDQEDIQTMVMNLTVTAHVAQTLFSYVVLLSFSGLQKDDFLRMMQERFLSGVDGKYVDYKAIDLQVPCGNAICQKQYLKQDNLPVNIVVEESVGFLTNDLVIHWIVNRQTMSQYVF